MKTNIRSNKTTTASLFALGLLSCGTAAPAADSFGRTGKVELSGGGQYLFGDSVNIPGYGVRLDIDNTFLGGIGVTYHFNDHLALGFDFGLVHVRVSPLLQPAHGAISVAPQQGPAGGGRVC